MDGGDRVVVHMDRRGRAQSLSINGQVIHGPWSLALFPTKGDGRAVVQLVLTNASVLREKAPDPPPSTWLQAWKARMFGGQA